MTTWEGGVECLLQDQRLKVMSNLASSGICCTGFYKGTHQDCRYVEKQNETDGAPYRSCFASSLGDASNGSWSFHPLPPSRILLHTLRKFGSSHLSIEPPSIWGPKVNDVSPGVRIRSLSKYEIGIDKSTPAADDELCQRDKRNRWVSIMAG